MVANALICLIHQADYLLDRPTHGLERRFVEGGGYTEQLAAARLKERRRQAIARATEPSATAAALPSAPICAACGKPMILRTARKGPRAGSQFWGCSGYPTCKAILAV